MQCYTQLVPPTSVTHAISLALLGSKSTDLVVARTSLLQVYTTKTVLAGTGSPNAEAEDQDVEDHYDTVGGQNAFRGTEDTDKLVLIGEYPLSGTVTSLAKIKALHLKTSGEALLVSFKDAKVSLIEWDPENHRISTISIHYYEGDKITTPPFHPPLSHYANRLVVDPQSRCAALRIGARHLAILPFRQAGEDLAEADYDPDLDTPPPGKKKEEQSIAITGDATQETPYAASFVLPLTALDPALTHPVDLAFLYEYREPTFGVLSANRAASMALLDERKDPLVYTVFTLDLEQRASTTLLSVNGLPYDIHRVLALPLPVGGVLLIGANELVHIDQAGKTNAVGLNDLARHCSNFSMADQSDLQLRLEDCLVETLSAETGQMLISLRDGKLAVLSFRIDGRSVSGLSVHVVDAAKGGDCLISAASAAARMGRNRIFFGSEDGDSRLLGWTANTAQVSRKRSHAQMEDAEEQFDIDALDVDDDDAEDDLYGGETTTKHMVSASSKNIPAPTDLSFRVHDTLPSIGPICNVCFGKSTTRTDKRRKLEHDGASEDPVAPLQILAVSGRGKSSNLVALNRGLAPRVISSEEASDARLLWTVSTRKLPTSGLPEAVDGQQDPEAAMASDSDHDQFLIVHDISPDGQENSKVYRLGVETDDELGVLTEEVPGTDFEEEGQTTNVGTLAAGTRIIQVRKSEIRSYDSDFGLSQIVPILDPTTDEELQVVHSTFCDPYVFVLRSDSTAQVLRVDESGDLDEVEASETFSSTKWLSGCLYQSKHTSNACLLFLITVDGGLQIFELPNLDQAVYVAPGLSALPPVLTTEDRQRRAASRETLTEVLVADLGDRTSQSPYLIVRSALDDLTLYEPFHYTSAIASTASSFTTNLRFRKVPGMHIPKYDDMTSTSAPMQLRVLIDFGGYATIFMAGPSPCFLLKEAASLPRLIELNGQGVRALTGLNTKTCEKGVAYVDSVGVLRQCQIPENLCYGFTGWATRKFSPLPPDHTIQAIRYHEKTGLYVICSYETVDFVLPDDETKQQSNDSDSALLPEASQYYLHLYEPGTEVIIQTLSLPPYEMVTSIECAPLEVSEVTFKKDLMIAVGTMSQRGEAFAAKGALYVLDVIDVVPEPGQPETGKQLHIFSREDTKGGITSLMGIAGLLGTAQGQKLMFRGLREDGQCLPVAFLDAQCYLTSLKTMGYSNLWLAADAWKGLWFGGFSEEPYKISLFGKSRPKMEVIAAEFLPFEDQLSLVVIDAEMNMHILQYDPENPKSLSGLRLLHSSTFHTGHFPTTMSLLPSTLAPFTEQQLPDGQATPNGDDSGDFPPSQGPSSPSLHHVLITSQSGAIDLLTPLDEATYRRLSALQTHLTSVLEHPAGLNPRAYRSVESEGLGGLGGARGIVDGDLICRIGELGAGRRAEVLGRAGAEIWGLRSDLEIISGVGLGYL